MRRTHAAMALATMAWLWAVTGSPAAQSGRSPDGSRGSGRSSGPDRIGIGREATPQEVAALDVDVMPDGTGLPPGQGTVPEGQRLYAAGCAGCHGRTGTEGPNDVLVGREPRSGFGFSSNPALPHTIGNYWPYATTLFDYIRRAMPATAPGSLTNAEVYALTAFLLHANEIVPADAVMNAETLPKVDMPARSHFVRDARRTQTLPAQR
ncbi:MAG: c-type cytochrome [Vicinamibacterales bacterium]